MGVIRRLRLSFWLVVIGTVVLYGFFIALATIPPGQVAALTPPGGIGPGTVLQPDRRPGAHRPCNPTPHAEPRHNAPDGAAVEIRTRVPQADVATNATDPPVSPRAHHAEGVRLKALAVGVTGAI